MFLSYSFAIKTKNMFSVCMLIIVYQSARELFYDYSPLGFSNRIFYPD